MENIITEDISAGVVGLGLMGTGVVVSLLISGHKVKAVAPLCEDLETAPERINNQLMKCAKSGLLSEPIDFYLSRLTISEDFGELEKCHIVLECVIEIPEIKETVFKAIEAVVNTEAVIATNTSALPISDLQKYLLYPQRFLGIHWAEPSYLTPFMEITCGEKTDLTHAGWVYELAHQWGKEPTLLRKDLRGFITNRLMYAVYREGLHLVENGSATLEDVDKSFRYDAGSWMTLMGIFRRMDLLGIKDYARIFERVFPELCNDETVSPLMEQMVEINARGTQNLKGLYHYNETDAKKWDEAFVLFNEEIYKLASSYSVERKNKSR
jgi:3-hydroxybutyryl-CoA dehydrogenase